ncbi:10025_t:CDS:2 [Rhizophagus irregularis]|nr:10025_t:CDS:2 [Rhizophagus irregularis]
MLHNNSLEFGDIPVFVIVGNLTQLPPVKGDPVFYSPLWKTYQEQNNITLDTTYIVSHRKIAQTITSIISTKLPSFNLNEESFTSISVDFNVTIQKVTAFFTFNDESIFACRQAYIAISRSLLWDKLGGRGGRQTCSSSHNFQAGGSRPTSPENQLTFSTPKDTNAPHEGIWKTYQKKLQLTSNKKMTEALEAEHAMDMEKSIVQNTYGLTPNRPIRSFRKIAFVISAVIPLIWLKIALTKILTSLNRNDLLVVLIIGKLEKVQGNINNTADGDSEDFNNHPNFLKFKEQIINTMRKVEEKLLKMESLIGDTRKQISEVVTVQQAFKCDKNHKMHPVLISKKKKNQQSASGAEVKAAKNADELINKSTLQSQQFQKSDQNIQSIVDQQKQIQQNHQETKSLLSTLYNMLSGGPSASSLGDDDEVSDDSVI